VTGSTLFPVIFLEVEGLTPRTQLQIGTNVSQFASWLSGRGQKNLDAWMPV
jgi:hypothetical protein